MLKRNHVTVRKEFKLEVKNCAYCGSEFEIKTKHKKIYCSKKCCKRSYYTQPHVMEKNNQRCKEWFKNNKERYNSYIKSKIDSDPEFKLRQTTRKRIQMAFKTKMLKKSVKTIDVLGCSIDDYKVYLESLFLPGMTWDNYGKYGWHIDHIIPISSFNLLNEEELKKAFHYTNTQPLWAEDNLRKSDKIL